MGGEVERDVTAFGDGDGGGDGVGAFGEALRHCLGRGQGVAAVVGQEAGALRLYQRRVVADRRQRVAQAALVGRGVVDIVRGDDGQTGAVRQAQ